MNPDVSVVIVTYNSSATIEACVKPLVGLENNLQIIVVDNNSSDDTCEKLARLDHPNLSILRNTSNLGFAKAVNIGVNRAAGKVIVLMNPDAIATQPSIAALAERAAEMDVVVAPLITHPSNRLRILSAGRFPTVWRMFTHYSGLSRLSTLRLLEGHYFIPRNVTGTREVDWATGACLAMSRRTWDSIGGLTERWFMYAEDIEFCWRAAVRGHAVVLDPSVTVSHAVGTGTSEPSSMRADWVTNLWRFYKEDLAATSLASYSWKAVVASGLLTRSVVYHVKSLILESDSKMWRHEAKRFRFFAKSLLECR